ncbi:MAG: 4-hydroxythreonine-4-phosphate dehydrogenase, partial [Myxococcales bacterium]|nr:4-hydroxythreonine-4-phosphate dehydrogenase [Myxococcales bacterium]
MSARPRAAKSQREGHDDVCVLPLAVSLGCPAGVGAEVTLAALAGLHRAGSPISAVLVGDQRAILAEAERAGIPGARIVTVHSAAEIAAFPSGAIGWYAPSMQLVRSVRPGKPTKLGGAAQLAWIDEALALVASGSCSALVTAPVSKSCIATSGVRGAHRFRGHTEHLAARLGKLEVVMAFANERFASALVTTHLPLRRVARAITPAKVARACLELDELLRRLGHARPRIAVAGLNPHAGEGGLLGDEEARVIAPGMALACEQRTSEQRTIGLAG